MAYLQREARRETIMQAARQVALNEGLAAMTVRRIASKAGVATGQLHHHFSSIAALRAETLIVLIRQMMDAALAVETSSVLARLQVILGCDDHAPEPYIRLWREAQLLVNNDEMLCQAYTQTMEMWHAETVKVLCAGQQTADFRLHDTPEAVAWRLIAMVCGLDGLAVLGLAGMAGAQFDRNLYTTLCYEVGAPPAGAQCEPTALSL